MENLLKEIKEILSGIDKEEDVGGWWETSQGAEFGAECIKEIEALFDEAFDMQETETHWVDGNDNIWNKSKYTEDQAKELSKTLIDCWGCQDCQDCWGCQDCHECQGCWDCWDCQWCRDCWYCQDCKSCQGCRNCQECQYCHNCLRCQGCCDMRHAENVRGYKNKGE